MQKMRVLWIGGGSLGMLFAGKCALTGACESALLVRSSRQKNMIKQKGLRLAEDKSQFTAFLPCSENMEDLPKPDWVALMVKQHHLNHELLHVLEKLVHRHSDANWLCFQNGIGHTDKLLKIIPNNKLFIAVTTEAAMRTSLHEVRHTGIGTTIVGSWDSAREHASVKKVQNTLRNAGFAVNVSNNIHKDIWKKLLVNAVINPLTAVLKVKNGALLDSEDTRRMMRELYEEGKKVANAEGIEIPDGHWEALVQICRRTSENHSSMLQDIMHGRKTELEWLNGSLLRLGHKHGIALPTHTFVYNKVREMENIQMTSH